MNPRYHPASQGLARQLAARGGNPLGHRRIRSCHRECGPGGSDPPPTGRIPSRVDRITARTSHPRSALHVRMDSEIGRERDGEARLREAMAVTESAFRDDPNLVMNVPDMAALYSDLGSMLGRRGQTVEAESLFGRALTLLEQARGRSPKDERIRRARLQTLASHAAFLGRLAVCESLSRLSTWCGRLWGHFRIETIVGCGGRSRTADSTACVSGPLSSS